MNPLLFEILRRAAAKASASAPKVIDPLLFKITNLRWYANVIKEFGGEMPIVDTGQKTKVHHPKKIRYVGSAHYDENHGTLYRKHIKNTKHNRALGLV